MMAKVKLQRENLVLPAGETRQFDTANACICRVTITVREGILDLWVGSGAVAGGGQMYRFGADPRPHEVNLPMGPYILTATAADNRDLDCTVMLADG